MISIKDFRTLFETTKLRSKQLNGDGNNEIELETTKAEFETTKLN